MRTGTRIAALLVVPAVTWCANAAPPGSSPEPPADVPAIARIVCEADGSTTVRTPAVLAQPDGVHVRVVSRLDEPASLGGFGRDVEPGESDWVVQTPPGIVDTACWPFSQHETLVEPVTTPVEVLDPEGLFSPVELECAPGESQFSSIGDYAAPGPDYEARIPLDEARALIRGLEPDDQVAYGGYPEAKGSRVVVKRDERVIAVFTFAGAGQGWTAPSSSGCADSGLQADPH